MKTIIPYILVVPLSFFASRLGEIIAGGPISFAFSTSSAWLRSTLAGIVGCIGGFAAAVAAGWLIFTVAVGPGSFKLLPFLASISLLIIMIPREFRLAKEKTHLRADYIASGKKVLANDIGNQWNMVIGDVCGLVLAVIWFFLR